MIYLLDTNVCIRYLNGRSERIREHIESLCPQQIVLCSIVKAELFYGAMKSANPARNLQKQKKFTDRFVSHPFDDEAAEIYGRIRSELEKSGKPIGPNDLMIASVAVRHDLVMVTHNTGEFGRVKDLKMTDWEL